MNNQNNEGNKNNNNNEVEEIKIQNTGACGIIIIFLSCILLIITLPFSLLAVLKLVKQYERAVIMRLGLLRDRRPMGPGLFAVIPCTDSFIKIDLRTISFDIPRQQMLTSDSVTVYVDAVMFYRVLNPIFSVIRVENAHASTQLIAQTTLRNVIGSCSLTELLSSREQIAESARKALDAATDEWGISVDRLEIKDVVLPENMQRAMAAEAEATRDARAKVILAEGELSASKALKSAGDEISKSDVAIQLKYLQALQNISTENSSTIVFPVPVDFMQAIAKKK